MEPLAIVGFSFKLPQGTVDEDSLWDVLVDRKNLGTGWPENRGVPSPSSSGAGETPKNTKHALGGHFINEDPSLFDATFFSISAKEAASMDPQHRWAMEAVYHAFENAGMPVETLRESQTGVVAASIGDDYSFIAGRDPDTIPQQYLTGNSRSILPNRISWFFDLRGPSIHIDTACSSSMVALDLACQTLQSGDASAMVVVGANLMLSPEGSMKLSNMNFLSADSRCFSFDSRANGYGRGEGIVALVVKPLELAMQNGDTIRAVIRATASNQDGRTPGLTQPSVGAQEALIRRTYAKAGLSFTQTGYFEAHGTGTPVGDPIEIKAIRRVFGASRSSTQPLFVGSVKSNIGHLEGASGLAAIVKSILVLERGVVPPQALFENINPDIDADSYNVQIPTQCVPWPTSGLRRVSVNSFGFGGSNSHVVLDDSYSYLRSRELAGYHHTRQNEDQGECSNIANRAPVLDLSMPRLLVWTAADRSGLERVMGSYSSYLRNTTCAGQDKLNRLSYTLGARRSIMPWRAFTVLDPTSSAEVCGVDLSNTTANYTISLAPGLPIRAATQGLGIAFVFTGQGAQYRGMGHWLVQHYSVFEESLKRSDEALKRLGCEWSVFDGLQNERLHHPEFSQPLCTILQIALVDLLSSFGVLPKVVVGHSSGEIAAAYTAGALSLESACKIAYFRGKVAGKLLVTNGDPGNQGAMLSVNLAGPEVSKWRCKLAPEFKESAIQIACFNSPTNTTLSGPANAINKLKSLLERDGIFAKVVNTGIAYHSTAMCAVADEYLECLDFLEAPKEVNSLQRPRMVSTVTGSIITPDRLTDPQYWVNNLVSPVLFAESMQALIEDESTLTSHLPSNDTISDFIEIGPHGALQRPIAECISKKSSSCRYHSVLYRTKHAVKAIQELVGILFCHGYLVSILQVNCQLYGEMPFLVDCPSYPFDHSRSYWAESRLNKNFRFRKESPGSLLGKRVIDWNPLQPRWRNWLSTGTNPWLDDHVINGTPMCPGMGLLVMAAEAVSSMVAENGLVKPGVFIKNAEILLPVKISTEPQDVTEIELQLQPYQRTYDKSWANCDVQILSHGDKRVVECFRAQLKLQNEQVNGPVDHVSELSQRSTLIHDQVQQAIMACNKAIQARALYAQCEADGLRYGSSFQLVKNIMWDGNDTSVGYIDVESTMNQIQVADSLVNPVILDACLHLLFVQLSNGLRKSMSTRVLHKVSSTWISSKAWDKVTETICLCAKIRREPNTTYGTVYALADDGSLLFSLEDVELSRVSNSNAAHGNTPQNRELLYNVSWQPRFSSLSGEDLRKLCSSSTVAVDETVSSRKFRTFDRVMQIAAHRALIQRATTANTSCHPGYFRKYLAYLERLCRPEIFDNGYEETEFESSLRLCEALEPEWALLPAVARSLPSIVSGETDPLALFFQTNLAKRFYTKMYGYHRSDEGLRKLLDLVSHENPVMRVLEIGAGTGGMTRIILDMLREIERLTGQSRFVEYVYTDLSSSFFGAVMDEFSDCRDRMVFKAFDVTRDPSEQGVAIGDYDIVVAGSVLHATPDLTITLANVRKLLKDRGLLLFQEITNPESIAANAVFGSLEGWWLSKESWRQKSPLLSVQDWDKLLQETGLFSGTDLVFHDSESSEYHLSSILVSSAVSPLPAPVHQPDAAQCAGLVVLIDPSQCQQRALEFELTRHFPEIKTKYLKDFLTDQPEAAIVICLVELGQPYLATIGETEFQALQNLVRGTDNILWVTSLPGVEGLAFDAHAAVSTGFLRSLRSENSDRKIVSLAFESGHVHGSEKKYILDVLQSCFIDGPALSDELEFAVRDGYLVVGRLVHELQLDEYRVSRVYPQVRNEVWRTYNEPKRPVSLEFENPGMLDSLRFIEDTTHEVDLKPDEVEIEATSWPVSFRDVFVGLGKLGDEQPGYECAGVITQVGSAVSTNLRPDDRVVMCSMGSMRSHPRAPGNAVFRAPEHLPLEDTVASMTGLTTAYHSLVNVARLQRGEKILIHSAAGGTGQMAIQIAQNLGAEVFVTVGSDEKKQLITTKFGISKTHIFYSRDTSFALGVKRVAGSVDVVLNSLSGASLQASWECIAPYGRFVELGKADIIANTSLSMAQFAKNASFAAVDLHHVVVTNPTLHRSLVVKAIDLLASGQVKPPTPLHFYPVSEAEKAFRYIQSGKNTGRTIISLNPEEIVPKFRKLKKEWRFDTKASYLIAGGFGGIGRAIIRWMASRGARNFIVLSRSGASTQAAMDVISELTVKGIQVLAPICDLSSAHQLSAALESCAGMPPIKGCINAAMALQDSVFENMTHAQWTCTIQSKVQASWNLHCQLPHDMGFFILLSSLAGTYGSVAQSNYAAGCAFQDSLARSRTAAGFRTSVSLDLGWMREIGMVAESNDPRRHQIHLSGMQPVDTPDFFAILEHYLDPALPPIDEDHSQLLVGAVHPARFLAKGEAPIPLVCRPLFAGFSFSPPSTKQNGHVGAGTSAQEDVSLRFTEARSKADRSAVATAAVKEKVGRAVWIEADDVDPCRPLSDYGVDSLMAIELRSWIRREFSAEVTVFEIMGEPSIEAVVGMIVERTEA
ncbi:hypothetical protein F5B21DRAFT_485082 [Xylaria acuta]|nr:hypothetical protein F5B21DRAFT_485082 [Xylaria acuta]